MIIVLTSLKNDGGNFDVGTAVLGKVQMMRGLIKTAKSVDSW